MSQSVTLHLPDQMFHPLQRVAQATRQPIEQLLLTALRASLPELEGLPMEVVENLTSLETLDDQALRRVMLETVPPKQAEQIHDLLEQRQAGSLDAAEEEKLDRLQRQADLVMLRKARAAVLLRFRGQPIPTLAELSQLAGSSR